MPEATPLPAAAIVLARPFASRFEVLLVKRNKKSGFMPGAHVFPGGRIDESDFSFASQIGARSSRLLDGMEAVAAAGFVAAAVRETREEAGISLERDRVPDVDALFSWAWWITPESEPKRFDTRFFLAEVPTGTEAQVDAHETVEHVWLTPRGALQAYADGRIQLAPPTLCTLEDLAPHRSIAEAAASVPRPIRAVSPRFVDDSDGVMLVLPGDALHEDPARVFPHRTRVVMTSTGRFASADAPGRTRA